MSVMNSKTLGIFTALILIGIIGVIFVVVKKPSNSGVEVDFGIFDGVSDSSYEVEKGESPLFSDNKNRFEFNYPKEFSISQFGNAEEGETVLAQRSGEKAGFQIFITTFDEPIEALTVERIKSEIPDLEMNNVEPVNWNGKRIGISFSGSNSSVDPTREIWIVNNGYLYQMTTYLKEQKLLKQVLETWKFK